MANGASYLGAGASGAASGAAAGTMIAPGVGTAIGAGVGAGVGLLSTWLQNKADEEQNEAQRRLLQEIAAKIQSPDFDQSQLSSAEFDALQIASPEIAQYVIETPPQMIREAEGQGYKAAQQKALEKYGQLAETGEDATSRAATERAQFESDQAIKSQRANLLSQLANRGVGGSGQEILAQTASAQDSQAQARQASMDAAAQAQQRRLQALGEYGQMATQMRGDERQVEQANVGVINAFNERMTRNQNLYNQYAAGQRNEAQQRREQLAQAKAANRQNIQQSNLGRSDELKKYKTGVELSKAGLSTPIQSDMIKNQFVASSAPAQAVATVATQAPGTFISYKNAMNEEERLKQNKLANKPAGG